MLLQFLLHGMLPRITIFVFREVVKYPLANDEYAICTAQNRESKVNAEEGNVGAVKGKRKGTPLWGTHRLQVLKHYRLLL